MSNRKMQIVTRVQKQTCSCQVAVVGAFLSRAEALKALEADMTAWQHENEGEGVELNRATWSGHFDYSSHDSVKWNICADVQWDISDVEMPTVPSRRAEGEGYGL